MKYIGQNDNLIFFLTGVKKIILTIKKYWIILKYLMARRSTDNLYDTPPVENENLQNRWVHDFFNEFKYMRQRKQSL